MTPRTIPPGQLRASLVARGLGTIAALVLASCAREAPPAAPARPATAAPVTIAYAPQAIGAPVTEFVRPMVTNVQVVDLDRDGMVDVLYCEAQKHSVRWVRQAPRGTFTEQVIGTEIPGPAHVWAADVNGSGRLDVLVASMGKIMPTNERIGAVVVLENVDNRQFRKRVLLDQIARVTDLRAANLAGHTDGRLDLVAGQFGYDQGETRWLENRGNWQFVSHTVNTQSGAVHTPLADFDGDGRTDIAALITQEWEEVHFIRNLGGGQFRDAVVWGSTNEQFGCSGMTAADVNRDGRTDLVFTNGDALDYFGLGVRSWFGLQWLENRGDGTFGYHRVGDLPGAFGPNVADLNGDGHPDLVAVSPFADWSKPTAVSLMAWLNDGRQNFTPVILAHKPTHLMTAAVGDLDGNGVPVIVTGGFHAFPPWDNMSNLTLWRRKEAGGAAAQEARVVAPAPALPREVGKLLEQAAARHAADPEGAEALATRGRIYHANGMIKEARACWEALRTRQPAEGKWSYYLADLDRLEADEGGLRAGLGQTIRLAPDYAPAWLELAELEFKAGRLEETVHAYQERLKRVPGDPYASLGLARVALQQDHRAEGRRLVRELADRVPDFPSAHNLYAELLAQDGDLAEAANQRWLGTVAGRFRAAPDPWKEELRPYCCDVDQLIVWGAIDLQTRTGGRGKAYFERAVQVDPQNPQGYENLGLYFTETGNPAEAAAVLERGSQLPRASELLYSYLGDAYLQLRRPDKALEVVERGLKLMPTSARFLNLRGLALARNNQPEEAIAAYRQAMVMSPGLADPVANLGLALVRQGRREEAVATLKQALVLQPGQAKALTNLAHLELDAGNLGEAARLVFPYFQQFPGLGNARVLMARYHLMTALAAARRGDAAAIEKACREGLALVPESPELNGFLGIQQVQQGRLAEGLASLETSYRLQPADPRVALALAELYLRQDRGPDAQRVLEAVAAEAQRRNDTAVGAQVAELLKRIP